MHTKARGSVPPLGRFTRIVAIATLSLVSSFACGAAGGSGVESPGPASGPTEAEVASSLLALTNQARSENGVSPEVEADAALARVALGHSEAMRDQGFFGHTDPSGRGLKGRLDAGGITYTRAGENLAQVSGVADPARLVLNEWMSSSEHRVNILNPAFATIGIGVARSGTTYWITQDFTD